jgi:signal transduction histidine kinase
VSVRPDPSVAQLETTSNIINDTLFIARIEVNTCVHAQATGRICGNTQAGAFELELAPYSARLLVEQTMRSFQAVAAQRNIKVLSPDTCTSLRVHDHEQLECHLTDHDDIVTFGDRMRLRQVLSNLIRWVGGP